MNYFPAFCWSDRWCIEGKIAWFITGESNVLMQYDFDSEKCLVLSKIPYEHGLRWNPECIKCDDEIICLPDRGKDIWVYSLKQNSWEEVVLEVKDDIRKVCQFIYIDGNDIYFVSRGLGQLYVLDKETKNISFYSFKSQYEQYTKNEFKALSNGAVINRKIYFAFAETSYILIFDLCTKESLLKKIPVEIKIMRLQGDGDKLWMVGLDKAIYIWYLYDNEVIKLENFPKTFGGYIEENNTFKICYSTDKFKLPLFGVPIVSTNYVWLIPWYGTEILYINKKTLEISKFEIKDEIATDSDLYMLGCKYLINYIRNDRYLGIFSGKNGCMIEIDMEEKKYQYINMSINKEDILKFSPLNEKVNGMLEFFISTI